MPFGCSSPWTFREAVVSESGPKGYHAHSFVICLYVLFTPVLLQLMTPAHGPYVSASATGESLKVERFSGLLR